MKRNITLLVLVIALTIVAFAIALPTLYFNWGNQEYRLRGVDPSDFNSSFITKYFAFQQGIDLQGGTLVTLDVEFSGQTSEEQALELENIKSALYWRMRNAKIADYQINVITDQNNKNKILIKVPQDIDETLMSLLITPANFTVWVEKPTGTTQLTSDGSDEIFAQIFGDRVQVGVNNSDVASVSLISNSQCYFNDSTQLRNYCLRINLTPAGKEKFANALLAAPSPAKLPLVIAIDYSPVGVQAGGQIYNPSDLGSEIIIYPLIDDNYLTNSILSAMIGSEPINANLSMEKVEKISPTLGENTLTALKISLLLGFVGVNSLVAYYYRERSKLFIATMVTYLIWSIAFFKILNLMLNMSLIGGYVVALIIFIAILISAEYKIRSAYQGNLTNDEMRDIYNSVALKLRNITILVGTLALLMDYYGTQLAIDFSISLAIGIMSGMFVVILAFKAYLPYLMLNKKK